MWPGTGWANTEFRTFHFTEEVHEEDLYGNKIECDNASIMEPIESRKRRGKADPPAPRHMQKQYFIQAMTAWENQIVQNAANEQEQEEQEEIKQKQPVSANAN